MVVGSKNEFGTSLDRGAAALVALLAVVGGASAQSLRALPETVVTASRLGEGVTGASTTILTARDIERFPGETLQDLLSAQPGVQSQNLFGGVAGAGSTVDIRGFGAAATANTLVLVNGRRLNDVDLAGVDLAAIPRSSIERIEITRGNSGAVLYGDGAMGGVINIVTRNPLLEPPALRVDAGLGSYRHAEAAASASRVVGDTAFMVNAAAISSAGYRVNNELRQRSAFAELRRAFGAGEAYATLGADTQHLGLPGPRRVSATQNELASDRRGSHEPLNYADRQGINLAIGGTGRIGPGIEIVIDGGIRRKEQQSAFFFGGGFDPYTETRLTTLSLTPRAVAENSLAGFAGKAIFGIDAYRSLYDSDRMANASAPPAHRYDLTQDSLAAYAQQTLALRPDTDLSFGARIQRTAIVARDRFDASAPGTGSPVQGRGLDRDTIDHALHAGAEHRFAPTWAAFLRVGRSFRLPNVDERVGSAPFGTQVDFALRTQTSRDVEVGVRRDLGWLSAQASIFEMRLRNELHYNPSTFTNVNLDPTRRRGVETAVGYRVSETLRLRGAVTYAEAQFTAGRWTGNDVPLVSSWTGSAGLSWDIVPRSAVFDASLRRVGDRRFDNDQANFQPLIPGHDVVDLRLAGEIGALRWSLSAFNLLDAKYFDYGVASDTVQGRYNAYPMPGRAFVARIGATF